MGSGRGGWWEGGGGSLINSSGDGGGGGCHWQRDPTVPTDIIQQTSYLHMFRTPPLVTQLDREI